MDIALYLRALRANWVLVVLATVLGAGAAGVFSELQTPQYRADVQLFISISAGSSGASDLYQGGSFAQDRVRSYTNIVTSPSVTTEVISELHLPYTPDEMAKKIEASSPLNTVLLDVSVTDPSPERARDIANALARDFTNFVEAIETPTGSSTSPVKATITKNATLPTNPVSPKTTLNVALGLLVGVAVGAAVAIMRQLLDRRIHGRREIETVIGAAVVGDILDDPKIKKRPLMVDEPAGPRAEAFRRLRTNIRFMSIDKKLSSLVVTGSVPDEGKSTVAANLAIALAQAGETVVLIDADLRRPSQATRFALPAGVGLTSVLVGDVRMESAMHHWRRNLPLYVMTSGPIPPNPSELLGSRKLADMVASLVASNMTVIFDSPPMMPVTDAALLALATDGALIVTRMGATHTDQLAASLESLRNVGARILGVVANRTKREKGKYAAYGRYYSTRISGHDAPTVRASARVAVPEATTLAPQTTASPSPAPTTVDEPDQEVVQTTASPAPATVDEPGKAPVQASSAALSADTPGATPIQHPGDRRQRRPRGEDTQKISIIELQERT
jgi:capsular exopolysaccharide synthesis family protein